MLGGKSMTITVMRTHGVKTYILPSHEQTLLQGLLYIKENLDKTLGFDYSCRSGVCGSCAVLVNGKEKLACEYKVQAGDVVAPLRYMSVLRDLMVAPKSESLLRQVQSWMIAPLPREITEVEAKRIEVQTDCILCHSCYSACPVLSVNQSFAGPFALTRIWRYVADVRESDSKTKIETIQANGVWDCTLCGECTLACPQGIDPKNDIALLRMRSVQEGYSDPNFISGDFSMGGFDPNF